MISEAKLDRLADAIVAPECSISNALERLERAGTGVLMLAGEDRRILGTLTDGDIRRALLGAVQMTRPCVEIACRTPLVAPSTVTEAQALELMNHSRDYPVDHLPIVNPDGGIVGLLLRYELAPTSRKALNAVIMAGGYGSRLKPLTDTTPKPMLPVGDRPLLEHTIERLRRAGVRRVNVTTHYLADAIASHFGDGKDFGVELSYVSEDRPLGTAGALHCLKDLDSPTLVLNGDILTDVPYNEMLAFHRENGADATVGVRTYDVQVPFGVIECDGVKVLGVREKPRQQFLVAAGVYLMEPTVHQFVREGERVDMPELIERLIGAGRTVVSFPIHEYWIDIGQIADYERAQADFSSTSVAL